MKKENAAVVNLSMFSNFFELLNLEQKFDINQEQLQNNYIKLQNILHPDKLNSKSHAEKIIAIEAASKLNEAYHILKDNKKRAEYLLSLNKIIINQETDNNVHPDPMMLNEILELSEDPDLKLITKMKAECWNNFKENYSKNMLNEAAQAIIKLQYLNKIHS